MRVAPVSNTFADRAVENIAFVVLNNERRAGGGRDAGRISLGRRRAGGNVRRRRQDVVAAAIDNDRDRRDVLGLGLRRGVVRHRGAVQLDELVQRPVIGRRVRRDAAKVDPLRVCRLDRKRMNDGFVGHSRGLAFFSSALR